MKKDIFQSNNIIVEVRTHNSDFVDFWIQAGQAGFIVNLEDLSTMHELIGLIIEDFRGDQ